MCRQLTFVHNGTLPLSLFPGFDIDPISWEPLWLKTLLFRRSTFHWLPVTWLANEAKQCVLTPSPNLVDKENGNMLCVMSALCQSQFNRPTGGLHNKSCIGGDRLSAQPTWKTPMYTTVPFQNKSEGLLVDAKFGNWAFGKKNGHKAIGCKY